LQSTTRKKAGKIQLSSYLNLIGPRFLTHSAPEETNIWCKDRKNLELHINQHIGDESFQSIITSNSENSLKNISKLHRVKHAEKMYLHIMAVITHSIRNMLYSNIR